jgi:sulfur carrier protein ThiS
MEEFTRRAPAAVLRDLPRVQLPEGATVNDLLRLLGIPTAAGRPLVSVNGFYQRDDATLSDGDRVQLLRTVVGG